MYYISKFSYPDHELISVEIDPQEPHVQEVLSIL